MLMEPCIGHHRQLVSVLFYIGEVKIHASHRHVLKPTEPNYLRKLFPNDEKEALANMQAYREKYGI